jgi:hypothetical protein
MCFALCIFFYFPVLILGNHQNEPLPTSVEDPHHIDADPDPTFTLMQILILIKVIWSRIPPRLQFESPRLHCERPRSFMALYLAPQSTAPDFDFEADPDLGFHSDADPVSELASENYADPDTYCCLPTYKLNIIKFRTRQMQTA